MDSIKKNYIYNVIYQILLLIIPLITVPYVSRVLGAEKIGIYSYTYSVVYYFMLLALLGINNYGNRTIAKCRDNKKELSKNFLSIYAIQLSMSVIMIIAYIVYINVFKIDYKEIAYIQMIYLIANTFDINWFFFGLEKFKVTISRNIIIKLLSLGCIFIFVKHKNDLPIYTLILSVSTLASQLYLMLLLPKEITFEKINKKDIIKHIKPIIILFLPVVAVSLYKVMDKIMIEKLSDVTQVGYYEQAEKITNIPMGLITALGTVMLPKMSNLVKKNKKKEILTYISKSVDFMMLLAFPISIGILLTAHNIIPILLGDDFIAAIPILQLLSITIVFISFANIIRTQYLIPKEKDKIYTVSVFLGAVVNLLLNFLLISRFKAIGACIATICAEFTVMIYQVIMVRKELPIKSYFLQILPLFIKSIVMGALVYLVSYINISSNILSLICKISVGVIVYLLLNIKTIKNILKDEDSPKKLRKV